MPTVPELLALALQHHQAGRLQQAEQIYRQIITAEPQNAEVLNELGRVLRKQQRPGEAIEAYRAAVATKPDFADAHINLGNVLSVQNEPEKAIEHYERAIEFNPGVAEVHFNLANVLRSVGKLDNAISHYRTAATLNPSFAAAFNNLADALIDRDELNEAIGCLERALQIQPNYAEAQFNLGIALQEKGSLDKAAACYRNAIQIQPDFAEAHTNLGLVHLLSGNFAEGWQEYEWRWRTRQLAPPKIEGQRWNGESLAGRTILLHAEQGLGDTIQFVRYAAQIKHFGATVLIGCQRPLTNLVVTGSGIDHVVPEGEELPNFDYYAALGSLPRIMGTSMTTIPKQVPYLFANDSLKNQWSMRLRAIGGFRIGINWRGRPGSGPFRQRDIPLQMISSIASLAGVCLISLQQGEGTSELDECPFPVVRLSGDVDQRNGAFMDTAAVMKCLDLVITSDTAIAHLAGSLGVPVWVGIPFAPDWRWLLGRQDSPWYPTMRLFRQDARGDWMSVFEQIKIALEELVTRH